MLTGTIAFFVCCWGFFFSKCFHDSWLKITLWPAKMEKSSIGKTPRLGQTSKKSSFCPPFARRRSWYRFWLSKPVGTGDSEDGEFNISKGVHPSPQDSERDSGNGIMGAGAWLWRCTEFLLPRESYLFPLRFFPPEIESYYPSFVLFSHATALLFTSLLSLLYFHV